MHEELKDLGGIFADLPENIAELPPDMQLDIFLDTASRNPTLQSKIDNASYEELMSLFDKFVMSNQKPKAVQAQPYVPEDELYTYLENLNLIDKKPDVKPIKHKLIQQVPVAECKDFQQDISEADKKYATERLEYITNQEIHDEPLSYIWINSNFRDKNFQKYIRAWVLCLDSDFNEPMRYLDELQELIDIDNEYLKANNHRTIFADLPEAELCEAELCEGKAEICKGKAEICKGEAEQEAGLDDIKSPETTSLELIPDDTELAVEDPSELIKKLMSHGTQDSQDTAEGYFDDESEDEEEYFDDSDEEEESDDGYFDDSDDESEDEEEYFDDSDEEEESEFDEEELYSDDESSDDEEEPEEAVEESEFDEEEPEDTSDEEPNEEDGYFDDSDEEPDDEEEFFDDSDDEEEPENEFFEDSDDEEDPEDESEDISDEEPDEEEGYFDDSDDESDDADEFFDASDDEEEPEDESEDTSDEGEGYFDDSDDESDEDLEPDDSDDDFFYDSDDDDEDLESDEDLDAQATQAYLDLYDDEEEYSDDSDDTEAEALKAYLDLADDTEDDLEEFLDDWQGTSSDDDIYSDLDDDDPDSLENSCSQLQDILSQPANVSGKSKNEETADALLDIYNRIYSAPAAFKKVFGSMFWC